VGAGYFVGTVGRDTEVIRRYLREQETEDTRIDQLELNINQEPTEQ
jgi:putative transposase